MADDSVQTLVAKWILDTSSWEDTIKKAKASLAQLDSDEEKRSTKSKATSQAAIDALNKQGQALSDLKTKAAQAVAAEAKKSDIFKAQLEQMKNILAQQKAIVTESLNKAKAAQSEVEQLKKAVALRAEETKHLEKQEGILASIGKGLRGGLFGGGLFGSLLGGAGAVAGGELITSGIEKFVDKMKEFIADSGKLQNLTGLFDRLAKGRGDDPAEVIEKLRSATHNLVPELDLVKTANTFMQSSIKMSTEDMVRLTTATVGLARVNGIDAQTALNALNRSFLTGRAVMLAHVTGIQRAELQTRSYGTALSQIERQNQQFVQTAATIEKRFAAIGDVALTYSERLKQVQVITNELFEKTAQGTVKSGGFAIFMDQLGKAIEDFGSLESLGTKVGDTLGGAFAVVATTFDAVSTALGKIKDGIKLILDDVVSDSGKKGDIEDRLTTISGALKTFAEVMVIVKYGILEIADAVRHVYDAAKQLSPNTAAVGAGNFFAKTGKAYGNLLMGDTSKAGKTLASMMGSNLADKLGARNAAMIEELAELERKFTTKAPNEEGLKTPHTDPGSPQNRKAEAQARLQERMKTIQAALAATKEAIEEEKEKNEELYKTGNETMVAYYANKRKEIWDTLAATRSSINQEIDLQEQDLKEKLKRKDITQNTYNEKLKSFEADRSKKQTEAYKSYSKGYSQTVLGEEQEIIQARIKGIDVVLQATKANFEEQAAASKRAFDEELISADSYHKQRIQQIQDETDAVVKAENQKALESKKTPTEALKYYQQAQAAILKGQKELSQIEDQRIKTAFNYVQQSFGGKVSLAQQSLDREQRPGGSGGVEIQRQIIGMLNQQVVELQHLALQADPYSATWTKIQQEIYKTTQHIIQMQQTMERMQSISSNVGSVFGALSGAAGGFVRGQWGQGFIRAASAGAQQLADSPQARQNMVGTSGKNVFQLLGESIHGVVNGEHGSFKKLSDGIANAVQGLGTFIGTISNANSPAAGAVGGAMGGAGFASSLGLQGVAGQAAPFAGAAVGAVMGFIAGGKQQQIEHQIQQLQKVYTTMMSAFQAQNASLNTTIASLTALIAQAEAQKASSKKGGQQFGQLITQYNQQLQQLQEQQEQIMFSLKDNLSLLSAPQPYQEWISNIQGVLDQYKKFAGAAKDTSDLANANKFLVESLQNTSIDMGNQIMQSEETAIQNALQLNDLYYQRNQLELQYLNTVFNIQAKGNIVRQRTQAQSAFSELFSAQANYQLQLDQINQQINLSEYQYKVAHQVFGLATTRIGLETQLLSLQEIGVSNDMSRIVAMQNLIAQLAKTGFGISTNLSGIDTSNPNALVSGLLSTLLGGLGVGGGSDSQVQSLIAMLGALGGLNTSTAVGVNPNFADAIFSAAYKSRAQFGYGKFRGQNV
jgi:hypothetical protein